MSFSAAATFGEVQFATSSQGRADRMKAYDDGTNGTPRTSSETRPVNVSTKFAIRY